MDAATFPGNSLSSDTLSDDNLAQVFYDPGAGANSFGTGYSNPEVAAILKDANQSLDDAVRAADFARMQTVTMADAESVPLFFTEGPHGPVGQGPGLPDGAARLVGPGGRLAAALTPAAPIIETA